MAGDHVECETVSCFRGGTSCVVIAAFAARKRSVLCQDVINDMAMDVRQAITSPLVPVGQTLVIDAHQM